MAFQISQQRSVLKSILILQIFLSSSLSWAQPEVKGEIPPKDQKPPGKKMPDVIKLAAETTPKPEDGSKKSWVPLAGFNPTYSVFVGGGYFTNHVVDGNLKEEFGILGVTTLSGVVKIEQNYNHYYSPFWRLKIHNEIGHGFESNFGNGNETREQDRVDVPLWKDEFDVYFSYATSRYFFMGPTLTYRIRRNLPEDDLNAFVQKQPWAGTEQSVGVGFKQELDLRNIPDNPNIGWYEMFHLQYIKPFEEPYKSPFVLVQAEVKAFQYLLNKALVLSFSIKGGITIGQQPYLYQYRLGGTDNLRGYYYNRFRGKHYYLQQTELRFPIYKALSGATFIEFGEATETTFTRSHVSYGAGIRWGLPPNGIQKIRIDAAKGFDQFGIFLDFGEAF